MRSLTQLGVARRAVLHGRYSGFGRVVDGMPVVEALKNAPVSGEASRGRVGVSTFASWEAESRKPLKPSAIQRNLASKHRAALTRNSLREV
ncbi:MAG: hypothetical protein EXQ55_03955 [Acidobacteria bacterium]|nr:hypothetical protein [Acidobacteriota bacterium]